MYTSTSLGGRLRERRSVLGLSQERLAQRIDVSKNTVARWENGETATPRGATLVRLATALGVSERWLIVGDAEAA